MGRLPTFSSTAPHNKNQKYIKQDGNDHKPKLKVSKQLFTNQVTSLSLHLLYLIFSAVPLDSLRGTPKTWSVYYMSLQNFVFIKCNILHFESNLPDTAYQSVVLCCQHCRRRLGLRCQYLTPTRQDPLNLSRLLLLQYFTSKIIFFIFQTGF